MSRVYCMNFYSTVNKQTMTVCQFVYGKEKAVIEFNNEELS